MPDRVGLMGAFRGDQEVLEQHVAAEAIEYQPLAGTKLSRQGLEPSVEPGFEEHAKAVEPSI